MSRLLRQWTSPYHLIHYAVFGYFFLEVYPTLRSSALDTEMGRERLLSKGYTTLTHEKEVCCLLVIGFLYKVITKGGFSFRVVVVAFRALQIISLVLTWLTGDRLALVGLLAVYAVMFLLLVPPSHQGDSSFVGVIRDNLLHDVVHGGDDDEELHLIFCHVPWSSDCCCVEPIFSQISVEYSKSGTLHFHSLDLSKNPELGMELEMDTTSRSKQLPSILLFSQGELIRRYPPFLDDGKVAKTLITKKRIIEYFELDSDRPSYRREPLATKKRL